MKEKWITDYEDLYKITEDGNVISYRRGSRKIMKLKCNKKGYLSVNFGRKTYRVHRLVAEAFIENKEGFTQVDHKDENKKNNSVGNLRWCSDKMNKEYYWESRPDRKTKKPQMSQKEYLDKVSKPIIVDSVVFSSVRKAAVYIVGQNENKSIENVRKELRKMINGKRSFGTIYGHVIEEVKDVL